MEKIAQCQTKIIEDTKEFANVFGKANGCIMVLPKSVFNARPDPLLIVWEAFRREITRVMSPAAEVRTPPRRNNSRQVDTELGHYSYIQRPPR